MPELSDLLSNKQWVAVEIGSNIIQVAYRPTSTSLRKQAEMQKRLRQLRDAENMDEFAVTDEMGAIFCEIVCDWDLTLDGRPLPVSSETVIGMLPGPIYQAIMDAVSQDKQAGVAEKKVLNESYAAGSRIQGKLEVAQNGIPSSERRDPWA